MFSRVRDVITHTTQILTMALPKLYQKIGFSQLVKDSSVAEFFSHFNEALGHIELHYHILNVWLCFVGLNKTKVLFLDSYQKF